MSSNRKLPTIMAEDVVISGMSGRFPESDSTDEFAKNLYSNADLITDESRRWPKGIYGMCPRMGQLKEIDKFDVKFFGIMERLVDQIEPQARILLEASYEAIIDAGLNPQSLYGSKTGVYIGISTFGMPDGLPEECQPDDESAISESILWLQGNGLCLNANRISFLFDFKGPSLVIDTACSSSLVALNVAMNDLRLGKCDQAIVGGTHINLLPYTNNLFQTCRLNAVDGIPKVWDEKADGYARSEAVACFLLQKRSVAKRIYGTILNTGVNIDGNKKMGIFYPSSESQQALMVNTYTDAGVDPLDVNYFEAHATGTKAGDPQEATAIYNAFCKLPNRDPDKDGMLAIGLSKSIIGHAEGASGVTSMIKVLLAYENECICANRNLNQIKSTIAEFCPPLNPIRENFKYSPGIAGVTNFGVGGVNGHVLLEPNYKTADASNLLIAETIPRIVNICSRTEETFNQMCKWIEENPNKITRDFLALLSDTMKHKPVLKSSGLPYRGSIIIKKKSEENELNQYEYKKQYSFYAEKSVRPVWFVFPGLGGQWVGMAKALMPIKVFADKIEECHEILKPFGIDLKHLLLSDDKNSMSTMTNKFCATTAIEIALMDVMTALNIIPDGIIGHSFGEIACAYADGCLNTKESILVSYIRGKITESDKRIPMGLMAVVGMSWSEARRSIPNGVSVVCNNGKDTVVVSGTFEETKKFVKTLSERGVFVHELQSSLIPYHSEYLMCCSKNMQDEIKAYLPEPKLRSEKWVSTAVLESEPDEELKYASAEYFVHNLVSSVYFYDRLKNLPLDAIVVEIGPHGLFGRVVKETLEMSTYLSLMKKSSNDSNLDMFLGAIAKLYELGLNPTIENLYPRVEWPVSRSTQSISSLMKWEHSKSYFVRKFPDYRFRETSSDLNIKIDIANAMKNYLPDHCIDGNILFPATGYLLLAWRRLAVSKAKHWNQTPVLFEDVQFRRPVFLSETETTTLKVRYYQQTGEFVILEHNNVLCLGKIRSPDEDTLQVQDLIHDYIDADKESVDESELILEEDDIYKELRVRGYDYGPHFRCLKHIKTNNFKTMNGNIEWTGTWITFMDALFQTMAVGMPFRKMMVPVMIKKLRCDPIVLFDAVAKNKCVEPEKEDINKMDVDETFENMFDDQRLANIEDEGNLINSEDMKNKYIDEIMADKYHYYKSIMPFHVDLNSRMIVTQGVEIEDVMALPIPRKSNIQDLKLESYQFVANEDMNAIEECDRSSIAEYIKICSLLADKIKIIFDDKNNNNIKENGFSDEFIKNYFNNIKDNQILFKTLMKLNDSVGDENQNLSDKESTRSRIGKVLNEIQNAPEFDTNFDVINQVSKNEHLIRSLLDIVSENNIPKKEIRVLEINLNGSPMAEEVDNHLASSHVYPIDVEYNIAVKSIDGVNEDLRKKSFKFIEWDSTKSNFPSDILLTNLVIVKDSPDLWDLKLEDFLQEVSDCVSSKGFLISVFRNQLTAPEMALNEFYGKKKLNDLDLLDRINNFVKEAEKVGFSVIANKSDSIGSIALLFRKIITKKPEIPDKKYVIEINDNCEKWFEDINQILLLKKETEKSDTNIWLIANDSPKNGIIGLINCLRLEPGGDCIRCLFDYDNVSKISIDFKSKPFSDILANDLAINVLRNGKIGTYRHLTLPKDYDKIVSNKYFLNIGQSSDLTMVQWYDSTNIALTTEFYDINNKRNNKIHCNIYSSGLNFKDVMFATGRIVSGPLSLFTDCVIGFEFAGRRTDTGERIMGFDMSRCFATSIDAMERFITPIPDHWSMDDAVTVLVVYSTVWYGLIEKACLQKNESILIHSGAGGVGQAAIRVCQYYNCDIYVTVGTEEKKKFLINEYNIPENRIFSSRDIQFKRKIKSLTEGKGVDLVLNSLVGDKLDASYECVADCGRFVEIGKYDLQMNKQLGMFSFLRDISFIGVSVDQKLYLREGFTKKFFNWMHENCNNGMIKPINRTVYKAEDADKAFRFMTTGKHIGKLVIKIRDEESTKIVVNSIEPTNSMKTFTKTYFSPHKVYIITGGLGGFGIELMHWMLFLGARKFVLTSRYGITNAYQKFLLERLEFLSNKFQMFGSKIVVSTHDCKTINGTKELINEANLLGPIGGIFHLALVLNDCLFENQTIDKFCETIDSKTKVFENLDKLSRELNIDLDYFVVFSSVSCGKGNAGQSNYGYANSVCERICESRRRDGLHGLAIQWGPVGDVGVIANTELSAFSAVAKQRINSCLDILDKLLQTQYPIVSCVLRAERNAQLGTKEARIVGQMWQALGIDPKTTPNYLSLGEIGMESMFAVELQQGLERDYDIKVALNDVKNITVGMMKDFEAGKVEEMRGYAEDARMAREKLSKVKFIIPTETHQKLNNVKTGKPVFFMPPLEGLFASLEGLAEKIDRPVIGLNWTKEVQSLKTVKEIYTYYKNLLKSLSPNSNYDLLGTLDNGGVFLIKLLQKGSVNKALIIDMVTDNIPEDVVITDEYLLETSLKSFAKSMPKPAQERLWREIRVKSDIDSKIAKLSADIKDFVGKGLVSRDLEVIMKNSYLRLKLLSEYRVKKQKKYKQMKYNLRKKYLEINGKLLVIKLFDSINTNKESLVEIAQRMKELYFIEQNDFESKLEFDCIEDNTNDFGSEQIASKINSYFLSEK